MARTGLILIGPDARWSSHLEGGDVLPGTGYSFANDDWMIGLSTSSSTCSLENLEIFPRRMTEVVGTFGVSPSSGVN